uniref:Uncharacterized protein n=1 Tax=Glossina brevipalpis TaxID=37001 RepID=A0A1A9X4Q7_9MUSC
KIAITTTTTTTTTAAATARATATATATFNIRNAKIRIEKATTTLIVECIHKVYMESRA